MGLARRYDATIFVTHVAALKEETLKLSSDTALGGRMPMNIEEGAMEHFLKSLPSAAYGTKLLLEKGHVAETFCHAVNVQIPWLKPQITTFERSQTPA